MTSRHRRRSARSARGRGRRGGFSLIEVMGAVMLLAGALVIMLELRNSAITRAMNSRNLSIASRMAILLMHRIEAAQVSDLFDGYNGDFSDYGHPDFSYVIGLGDSSVYTGGGSREDAELAWRQPLEEEYEEGQENDEKPEKTRAFITVYYPSAKNITEQDEYLIETLIPTWAVYQDIELWEELWAGNIPEEVK